MSEAVLRAYGGTADGAPSIESGAFSGNRLPLILFDAALKFCEAAGELAPPCEADAYR